jgi:glucokinase
MNKQTILIADIGGTNARFALSSNVEPFFTEAQTLQCIDHPTLMGAIDTYLLSQNINSIDAICFAVAGPIKNEAMSFLNNSWSASADELRKKYNTSHVKLMNDFEAVSFCLSELSEADILKIGLEQNPPHSERYRVAVVGPGSGLGVAGLNVDGEDLRPLASEGGHVGFAPDSLLQIEILQRIQAKLGRVSNERLLSGPGLVNIHEALCAINKIANPGLTPADIAVAAREETDALCIQAMQVFFEVLGQVCGDTVLALGAYDGVYIGGGIAQRYPGQLLRSAFRTGFENKGRYRDLMETIPTWLITHKNPGLLGASVYANHYLHDS